MSRDHDHGGAEAEPSAELSRLREQATDARTVLATLQKEVGDAGRRLNGTHAERLLETNERLVLAMLRAQTDGEDKARTLLELAKSVDTDPLTGLPNRTLLNDRFARAIAIARRHETRLALLFIDLDGFKQVNDNYGHPAGDAVLKVVSNALTNAVRASDTVSRHGGDEFLILLSDISQQSDAAIAAEKVISALAAPARFGSHSFQIRASIGISLFPDDGEDADTIIANADAAMYRAKRHAPGRFAFFDKSPPIFAPLSDGPVDMRVPTRHELVISEHESWHAELREANEQLVLSALRAKELQLVAEMEREQLQIELTQIRHLLRND